MPPSSTTIRRTVEAYLGRHPGERDALAGLLAALNRPVDATARTTLPAHITCSAAVIDRQGRVLHVRHRATEGLVLAPGGHVEPEDRTLLAAALRAGSREAGIAPGELCLTRQLLGAPIDISFHDIDASPAAGEPAHRHYDFRYVFYLAGEEPPSIVPQDEEVSGALWLPQPKVTSPALRAKLLADRLDGQPEPVNASALIHDGAGRYLLHLRDHKPGVIWESGAFALLGGGRTREDQSLEGTLLRELSEEVPGLRLQDVTPYAVEAATSIDGLSVPVQVFAGRWRGNPDRLALHEGVLLRWFTPDDLGRLRLDAATRDLIHRHAADNPPDNGPDAVPPVWDGGSRTVLNGIGVHLHLEDSEGRVLLGLRHPDSKYAGSTWHYLAGRCEQESALTCLVREAREEAGLVIDPADVELVHVVHVVDAPGGLPLMQLVFRARRWEGAPELREPDKCLSWQWWPRHDLPHPTVPYTRTAIAAIAEGRHYSQLGW
ncbi:NUDIX hydrolase [Streptomyces acidiscabies]|uniref:NUDIX domain-containing protein n=1 Tax=Streptomyces acidiscabies TaxID=42234 RepID=A0ABU4MEL0_9ACTN|nr:NUDIX domain-containing protein [Streptomyces acidiscabies]MDX3025657.1 NUDIX domain-containing protein [Streptomyces acidiscabies]